MLNKQKNRERLLSMKKRPLALTIIGWILIVMGIFSMFATSANLKNQKIIEYMSQSPLPLSIQYAILTLGVMFMTISGLGILKGKNWGRLLYVGWGLGSFLMSLAIGTMQVSMIPGMIIFLITAYFLFRPDANVYFSPADIEKNQPS
jgi:hypothetical protein